MLTTVIISVSGEAGLDLHFSLYLIEYLVVTLLFVYFNPRARRILNNTGYVLFAGFMVIVGERVLRILYPEWLHSLYLKALDVLGVIR